MSKKSSDPKLDKEIVEGIVARNDADTIAMYLVDALAKWRNSYDEGNKAEAKYRQAVVEAACDFQTRLETLSNE